MRHSKKTLVVALSAAFALTGANAFAASDLASGYMVASIGEKAGEAKCGEGKCGADKKAAGEHKCGEAKCGADKKAAGEHKCGEAKCGADKKATEPKK